MQEFEQGGWFGVPGGQVLSRNQEQSPCEKLENKARRKTGSGGEAKKVIILVYVTIVPLILHIF